MLRMPLAGSNHRPKMRARPLAPILSVILSVIHRGATLGAVLVALPLLSGGCSTKSTGPDASASISSTPQSFALSAAQRERIKVTAVQDAPFHRTVQATGTVAFNQNSSTQVVAAISGPVIEILVPLGTQVTAGTPLARVASPDFAAAVSGARKANVAATNLRRIADLDKKLFEGGNIGRREMEQAEADATSAEADRYAASETLRALGSGPAPKAARPGPGAGNDAFIRAPMDGTVVEQLITPGQRLEQGTTPCFTIARLSEMWVTASVFEDDLPFVKASDLAEIRTATSAPPVAGTVDYVGDVIDPATRAVPVRIVAQNPDHALKKDAYVNLGIHSSRESHGLMVRASAILLDPESLPFVFVQNADGSFSRRRVTVGVRAGDSVEIADGLRPGEEIVTDGGLFLQFAQNQ